MAKKNNPKNNDSALFRQLTRLLSGPLVNYRTQTSRKLSRVQLDKFKFQSASGLNFKKANYNPFEQLSTAIMANQMRAERYQDFEQMEYCLHGDTKIAVPGGYKTIKELAEEYDTTEQFIVYAYDHAKREIVPAIGKQARKTTTDNAWKVTFENGQEIIGTSNHRLMLRDGTYRRIDELEEGMAMMPFYRKDLIKTKKDSGDGYRWIYSMHNDEGKRPGWKAEHTMVAEWISGEKVGDNEVVHHRNFIKYDNSPDNLVIMNKSEHSKYHATLLSEQRREDGWWKEFGERHSKWMRENNPAERKDITFEKILYLCDTHGFNQKKICSMLDTDPNTIKRRLIRNGFDSFELFAKTYEPEWKNEGQDNTGEKNPRFDKTLSYQKICEVYENGMSSNVLAGKLDTTYMKIVNRIKKEGFDNFTDFRSNYHNHKVASVEYYGYIDLYDLTVDGYKNFATDTVISHNTPEIASALDIYADEMTTSSDLQPLLSIKCPNEEIKSVLAELYQTVLNIEFNLFGWCRTMCKYGDFFLYLDIDERLGVQSVVGLPTHEIERLEGEDKTNPKYIQFQWNSGGLTFENWQIGHFRILGNDKYAPYGTSVLEPARRIFRQLILLEDAMMAYRIVRAPERRVFYIDVGNVSPSDVEQYMQKVMTQMKRNQVVDSSTGRVDLRYNPMSTEEDYFIPVRGGVSSKIDTLAGGSYTGDIDDVKYLRDKLFSALKVPASYLSRSEGAEEDKTTLAQKDIRFARTIQRLQRSVLAELEKIGIIHLYTLGYKGADLISFKLSLNNPSKIAELQELEHWNTKFDIAASATDGFFSRRWVADNIFNLSEEEFLRNQREMFYDRRLDAELEAVAAATEAEAAGGLGGGLDSEIESELAGEEDLLGDEDFEDTDIADDVTAGGEDPLLAAPGKRDDARRKGQSGPRKRHIRSKARGMEVNTPRKNNPGGVGYETLHHLSSATGEFRNAGLFQEEDDLVDKIEERKLFEVKQEIKKLITELDNSKLGGADEKKQTQ